MFGIYKYVYDDEIIYIGKSDNSILNRVNDHAKEEKFQPYLDKAIIYYTVYENAAQTDFYESYFINKYKPKLNVAKMFDGNIGVDIPEPEWHLLSELKEIEKTKKVAVFKTQRAYERRIEMIKEKKKHIENLKWLESFLPRFYGLYDIEFSVDYTEENEKIYERIAEVLDFNTDRGWNGFWVGRFPRIDEEENKIRVHFLDYSLKEFDFWNNYKIMIQQTTDKYLAEIHRINSEIKEAGFDEYE